MLEEPFPRVCHHHKTRAHRLDMESKSPKFLSIGGTCVCGVCVCVCERESDCIGDVNAVYIEVGIISLDGREGGGV